MNATVLTEQQVPAEGEPGYREWRVARASRLRHQLLKAIMAVAQSDLAAARTRASVMVNIADVVHNRICPDTVRIEFSQTDSSDDIVPSDGREPLLGMWWALALMVELGHHSDPEAHEFDVYDDPRGCDFDALPPEDIRAYLIEHLADSDLVWVVRNEMKFRSFPVTACSSQG
jgi:hypothetical protein